MALNPVVLSKQIPVACFAPPLTDEKLARYRELINSLGEDNSELKDTLATLLQCVETWWELPVSKRRDVTRWRLLRNGREVVYEEVPLEEEHVKALWDVTPWMRELNTLSNPSDDGLFDKLPPGELRDCAFHLLWFCKELTLDREPLTQDVLG